MINLDGLTRDEIWERLQYCINPNLLNKWIPEKEIQIFKQNGQILSGKECAKLLNNNGYDIIYHDIEMLKEMGAANVWVNKEV